MVVAFAPEVAIITALQRTEFLVDRRRLKNITLLAELASASWLTARIHCRRSSSSASRPVTASRISMPGVQLLSP
ncbi:MAG: hypothetical protein CMH16_00685 [Methylobacterium sp.]|nr:hypothetical protein [Methylobacterium sp.]